LSTAVLNIKNLSKSYGKLKALDNFSLEVNHGEIVGILGPNGSGKTTTLSILLDILKADSGSFYWFGNQPTHKQRQRVGALLEAPVFYPYLSAVRNLQIIADIKNLPYDSIDEVLDLVGLFERKNSKYKTYSLGMKQRLAIAAALLGKPDVLIFDEPTNGLDPQGIAEIRTLITDIGKSGTTILLASHLLDEVQKVCTHVVILERGQKRGEGRVGEVLSTNEALELSAVNMDKLQTLLDQHEKVLEVRLDKDLLIASLKEEMKPDEINMFLAENGIYLTHLAQRKKTLENYFLEMLSDKNA
jgi:ABC-2 type transport system ATP-binding protein